MVQSAFEFADICRDSDYHNFLFSMKASNPLVMVQAYRLLAEEMYVKDWDYPIHLGVTEAGEGEDGRMKSAIGIGALLADGLGDTIRVSLTEDPELEIEPCRVLRDIGAAAATDGRGIAPFAEHHRDTHTFARRVGRLPEARADDGKHDVTPYLHRDGSVLCPVSVAELASPDSLYRRLGCKLVVGMPFKDLATSDSILLTDGVPPESDTTARRTLSRLQDAGVGILASIDALTANPLPGAVAVVPLRDAVASGGAPTLPTGALRWAAVIDGTEDTPALASLAPIDGDDNAPLLALLDVKPGVSRVHALRRVFDVLTDAGADVPVIHHLRLPNGASRDAVILTAGSDIGALLVDGKGDGVLVECATEDADFLRTMSFGLLQGSRMRNTKTEYVSCPSCGRTLFDLQDITEQIRERTGHLPGVSIAIMGCIVNGPGEMADADFGYVGGAPGKIDLYVGKEVVRRAVPMEKACDELVDLVKEHGRWVDPPKDEEEGVVGEEVSVAA